MRPSSRSLVRAELRGFSIVPLLTPFAADGGLDEAGARRLVDHVVEGGCQGVLVAGTTGEAASMPLEMRVRLVEIAVEQAAGRALVFGGIGDNCFQNSLALARRCLGVGATAVVSHLPAYYSIDGAEMEGWFRGLADQIDGPLYLYNIPQTTRLSLPLDVVERLSHHPRIAGIKDSEPDAQRQEAVARHFAGREDFSVFCGTIPFTAHAMRAGADGFVPSAGNVAPRATREAMDRWIAGDEAGALAVQQQIAAVSAVYQKGRNLPQSLGAAKAVLELMGICSRHMLPPLRACSDVEVADLQRQLAGIPR